MQPGKAYLALKLSVRLNAHTVFGGAYDPGYESETSEERSVPAWDPGCGGFRTDDGSTSGGSIANREAKACEADPGSGSVTPDEDAEVALREAYCDMVSKRLRRFAESLDWPDGKLDQDALTRLWVRLDCPPAYSTWRASLLREQETRTTEVLQETPYGASGRAASPGAARLRAVQILGGERASQPEWRRLVMWATKHGGKRLKGDDGRWNVSEDELAEALG